MKKTEAPRLFAGTGEWFRFSAYEVVTTGHVESVFPVRGAKLMGYRPFDHYPAILRDYLDLGSSLRESTPREETDEEYRERDRRHARRVLAFAEKYGLPGTLWQSISWFDWRDGSSQIFVPESLWALSVPHSSHESPVGLQPLKNFLRFFVRGEQFSNDQVRNYSDAVVRAYGEPVPSVQRDALDILTRAEEWKRFQDGAYLPEDPYIDRFGKEYRINWRQALVWTNVEGVGLRVRLTGKVRQLDYDFPSLISALRIMLALNVVSEQQQIRLCDLEECTEWFIAKNARTRHCCDSHSNRDRQRSWAKTQAKPEEKTKKGKPHGRIGSRKTKK